MAIASRAPAVALALGGRHDRSDPARLGLPAPSLSYVCTVQAELSEPLEVGAVPLGTRQVIPIGGGTVAGERLRGAILPGGADWQIVDRDGTGSSTPAT